MTVLIAVYRFTEEGDLCHVDMVLCNSANETRRVRELMNIHSTDFMSISRPDHIIEIEINSGVMSNERYATVFPMTYAEYVEKWKRENTHYGSGPQKPKWLK